MIQWSRPIGRSNFFSAGFDWRRVDGDSLEDLYIAAPGVPIVPPTQQAVLNGRRNSGGTQRSGGLFLQDVFSLNKRRADAERARGQLDELQRPHLETSVATGLPTAGNRGDLPDKDDTVVSPRAGALYRVSDRVSRLGRLRLGLPCADAQRALSAVQRRSARTLANETLGPERLFGGEVGVRLEATRNVSVRSTLVRQPRQEPGVQRHASAPTSSSDRTSVARAFAGWQTDVETRVGQYVASGGGLSVQRREGHRVRPADPGAASAIYLAAGAEASRLGQRGRTSNPRFFNVAVSRHVLRPSVRRRPERAHQAG